MNILPFVTFILMIFGICSFLFGKGTISLQREYLGFSGQMRNERAIRNQLQKRLFKREKAKRAEEQSGSKERRSAPISCRTLRERKIAVEYSKLNLKSLIADPKAQHLPLLKETITTLLRHLYGHLNFERQIPRWEYRLVDEWASNPFLNTFKDLFPRNSDLSALFYKILKGTNQYNIAQKEGIAPLAHFFRIDEDLQAKAVHLAFASPALLSALFGDPSAQRILEEEKKMDPKEKKRTISKEALEKILLENTSSRINPSDFSPLLNFSTKGKPSHEIVTLDKSSGICIHRKIDPLRH